MARILPKTKWEPEYLIGENGRKYAVDMLYWTFIYSEQAVKGFCKRFTLNLNEFERYLAMTDWEDKKEDYKEKLYRTFAKDRLERIEERQKILDRIETHEGHAIAQFFEHWDASILKDYFARTPEGEIRLDPYGNPMMRMVPDWLKDAIERNIELTEKNIKVLIAANTKELIPPPLKIKEPGQKLLEGQIIDVDGFLEGQDE